MPQMAAQLSRLCSGDHEHETAEGSATRGTENYTWQLGGLIADVVMGCAASEETASPAEEPLGAAGGYEYSLDPVSLKVLRREKKDLTRGPSQASAGSRMLTAAAPVSRCLTMAQSSRRGSA